MANYYTIMNLPPTASQAEIKERFRFLANAYHPDKFPSPTHKAEAEVEFKKINQAYQVLSVPQERARYDLSLRAPQPPAAHTNGRPKQNPQPAQPPPASKAASTMYYGRQILTTVASMFVFYVLIYIFGRAGLPGIAIALILAGLIYTKYLRK